MPADVVRREKRNNLKMPKENTILTIDVGGDNLKMAEFVFPPGGSITLRKFAFRKFEESEEDDGAFAETYRAMLSENNFTAKQVRLSLSGQSSFCRLSKLDALSSGKGSVSKIVELEARQIVPYPMNEVVWDYQLIKHDWQETLMRTQEDGSEAEVTETHEEFEALFVAVKSEQITRYTDVIEESGKEILSVEIAPVALFNAAKGSSQCRADECVLLLNIGGRGANLMIVDHDRAFIRSIPIAGDSITHQVAKEFGITFEEAEDLKRRHGFVALGGAYEEPESEVAATISKIARNVMTRLHGEVSRSINVWRSQHRGHAPSRVLLSGGGSTMMYITDFFNEKLRLPVEYLNTFSAITISEPVDKEQLQLVAPMFQEMIGMSLRNVTQCPIDISLIPDSIRNQKELNRKKPYFYASAATLLVLILFFAYGIRKRLEFDKSRVDRVKGAVEATNNMMSQVNAAVGRMNSERSRFSDPAQFLQDRNKWSGMLTELQGKLPDTMWLVKLEGLGDESEEELAGMEMGGGEPPMMGGGEEGAFAGLRSVVQGPASPADILEVRRLRLVGYTLIRDRSILERELQRSLKESKYFSDADDGSQLKYYIAPTDSMNLSFFDLVVTLKEPIKK